MLATTILNAHLASRILKAAQSDIIDLWDVHVRVGSTLQRLSHVTPAGNQKRSFHNISMFGLDITKFSRNFFGLSGRAWKREVTSRTNISFFQSI